MTESYKESAHPPAKKMWTLRSRQVSLSEIHYTQIGTPCQTMFEEIRTVAIDNEPWLVGKDVAAILGYKDTDKAIRDHVDAEDKQIQTRQNSGFTEKSENTTFDIPNRGLTIINESGLYSLVLSSKLPGAKKFRRWVTSEVLPSIRRNGGYISGQEAMTPEELMAAALLMADKTIKERDAKISALTVENQVLLPKAQYFDQIVDRNLLTNFRETAKELGIKQTAFVGFLIDHKYVYRDKRGKLMPYAAHSENGLFEVKEQVNDKTGWSGTQTLITPKGRETFRLLCQGL